MADKNFKVKTGLSLPQPLPAEQGGTGQTSRVDAVKQSIEKCQRMGFETTGAVLASDAFFPVHDNIELAAEAGISAIVQPGGSVRDQECIDTANRLGIAMVITGIRHFKH